MKTEEYELLSDPFRGSTQSTKRFLYGLSIFSALVAYTGVMPTSPSVLGFQFPNVTETHAYWILFTINLFTFISFSVYFVSDYVGYLYLKDKANLSAARSVEREIYTSDYDRDDRERVEEDFKDETGYKPLKISGSIPALLSSIRIFLDGFVPIILAISSLAWLYLSKLI